MIEVQNLSKSYGNKRGVKDINFTIKKGEIVGLLGPNGAGKSTTMKMITGYIPPSEGTVIVEGYNILDNPKEVTKRIGFLPEIPPLYMEMQVCDYLHFIAEIKGVPRSKRKKHIEEIMDTVNIVDVKDRLICNLSKGYRQRVGFAQALVSNPPILIFDEPTVGLDPRQINEMRELINRLGENHTIIISSHILAEISMICKRVIILNKGEIVAVDTTKNLAKGIANTGKFLLKVKGTQVEVEKVLSSIDGITDVSKMDQGQHDEWEYSSFVITNEKDLDVREPLFNELAKNNLPIIEMRTMGMSLEDVFLQLTSENDNGREG